MGKINVVRDDGTVVSVDEELYKKAEGHGAERETFRDEQSRIQGEANKKAASGVGPSVAALLGGAVDTALGGVPGLAYKAVSGNDERGLPQQWGPEFEKNPWGYQNVAQQHPVLHTVGTLAGYASPFGVGGAASKVGGKVAGAVGSKMAGRAAEGVIIGGVGHVVHTNVTGDPLSIEGAVHDAGIGALLNVGFGAVADKFTKWGGKAKAAKAEAEAKAARFETARTDVKAFESNAAYDEAHVASKVSAKKYNTAVTEANKTAAKYEAYVNPATPKKLKTAIVKAEGVLNTVERRPGYLSEPAIEPNAGPFDLSDVATPQTTNIAADLKVYRGRISDIYKKQAGGWKPTGTGRWTKDPSIAADPAGALEDLRALQTELAQRFPKASHKLDDLPTLPSTPTTSYAVEALPRTLKEFAGKHEASVRAMAEGMDDTAHQAMNKLAEDLGIETGASAVDTTVAVHSRLRNSMRLLDELKSTAVMEEAKSQKGFLNWVKGAAKSGLALAAGRVANKAAGGGWKGALAHVGAADATKAATGYIEDSLLAEAIVASKESTRAKLRNAMARYGEPTGKVIKQLGPVTSILKTSFPSGQVDEETDVRKQTVNRITDIIHANIQAPDAMFTAVQSMMGHPADIGWKIHNQVTQSLQYLLAVAPKDPGLNMKMGVSDWNPSHEQVIAFAHAVEAVLHPERALTRLLAGDGHQAAADALWATSPASMGEFAMQLANNMPEKTTYQQASRFSLILRRPMSPLQEPAIALAIQGMYLPVPGSEQGVQSGGGGGSRPAGRPPAVQSQVAGSSVSGLIS